MAKDKTKGWYEDNKNLDYKDSWLQNTVELAAAGAIVAGAGHFAVKGDAKALLKPTKKAFDVVVRGAENYLKRNGSQQSKILYQIGKKTFFNLKKYPRRTGEEGIDDLAALVRDKVQNIDKEKARGDVAAKLQKDGFLPPFTKNKEINTWRDVVDDVLDGNGSITNNSLKNKVKLMYEKAESGQLHDELGLNPPKPEQNKSKWFGPGKNDGTPLFDKNQIARDMVNTGLTGLAFGAGISGFHAIDRLSSDKDNQKKLEDSFHFGGSFLSRKDDKEMKKEAGALEFNNGLKAIGKKTPEAIASGLGYTGISLATAKLLGDQKKKTENADNEPKGTRVIIELGDPESDRNNQNHSLPSAHGGALLPKFASFGGSFLKDLAGHGDEIRRLQTQNFDDVAREQLKGADVQGLLHNQYGNLVNDKTEAQFTKHLFDNKAKQLKQEADNQVLDLETRAAKAQLGATGGALAVGGGLAGLAYHNKKDDKNV